MGSGKFEGKYWYVFFWFYFFFGVFEGFFVVCEFDVGCFYMFYFVESFEYIVFVCIENSVGVNEFIY